MKRICEDSFSKVSLLFHHYKTHAAPVVTEIFFSVPVGLFNPLIKGAFHAFIAASTVTEPVIEKNNRTFHHIRLYKIEHFQCGRVQITINVNNNRAAVFNKIYRIFRFQRIFIETLYEMKTIQIHSALTQPVLHLLNRKRILSWCKYFVTPQKIFLLELGNPFKRVECEKWQEFCQAR